PCLEPKESGGAHDEPDAAERAQHDRQAQERIRRLPPEAVVIQGCDASRGEAQQETVERKMVEAAAREGRLRIRIGAAVAAAVEIAERERIARGARRRVRREKPR